MHTIQNLKKIIKSVFTFIRHPILISRLYIHKNIHGGGHFILRGRIKINSISHISFGSNIEICDNSRFLLVERYKNVQYQPKIEIGNNIFIGYNFSCLSASEIKIDDNVLIASNVLITSETHGTNPLISKSYSETPLETKPIHIQEGCWLGEKSIILPGVTLGRRCIVAAGAVVTKSFPDYCIVAGVPAKCIKRFDLSTNRWVNS